MLVSLPRLLPSHWTRIHPTATPPPQVLVAEAWVPVAAKARVQDALRQAAARASSAVGTVFQVGLRGVYVVGVCCWEGHVGM